MEHVCSYPAETATWLESAEEGTLVWPWLLYPQQSRSPAIDTEQVWSILADTVNWLNKAAEGTLTWP
jgi:hypothetical protein